MPRERFYLVGFLVAVLIFGFATRVGELMGWEIIEPMTMAAICVALTWIFPEPFHGLGWGARAIGWVAGIAASLCVAWTLGFWIWKPHSAEMQWGWRFVLHFMGLALITPWFEEKMVRHLLLSSALKVMNRIVAAILISLLFALVHKGMFLWALVASLVLCWMRIVLKAKTAHCAAVHGIVNTYVFALYFIA